MIEGDTNRPIAVDLFAGAGGLSLGFEQAGFDVAVAVEFDPIHAAIHELNFPYTTVICRDIRELTGDGIRKTAGLGDKEIDAVIGGPPCQGFSLIGHRVLDDARNELVFHYLRIVTELRPKTFVMENVPGMVTGQHHQLLDELIDRFERNGYQVRRPYRILNAAEYEVPQERRRLFVLGARSDISLPAYPEPTSTSRSARLKSTNGKITLPDLDLPHCPTVADAISDLPDIEDFETLLETDELPIRLSGGSRFARRLRGDECDPSDFSYQRNVDSGILTGCLRARHTDESRRRFAATPGGTTEPRSRFYKLSLDGTANTLRAGTASDRGAFSAPRPIHPIYPRCISVREAARLHSFPDWFRFHRTIWHGFRQIGNSVPPLLARAIGHQCLVALEYRPTRPIVMLDVGDRRLAHMDMRRAARHFGVSRTVIPPRRRAIGSETGATK